MTIERMIELLNVEHQCMLRNAHGDCDRACASCDLVQDDGELHEMYTEVIAQVRSCEPRVMTIDEVMVAVYAWLESRNGNLLEPVLIMHGKAKIAIVTVYGTAVLNAADYNVRWRCWTSKPTKEQREAVKWELRWRCWTSKPTKEQREAVKWE